MPIFSFSEADRKRWAAQGALAVQTAAERTRASMADNLEAFGEDSFPDVPGEVFDQQEWLDEMNGEIADYFDEIAAEAAYAFADGAEIDPTDGEDGGPGFFTSAAILAMTGLIGYEIAQMLSNRGEIVADRVETLMGRGSEDGWDSTRLGDELGLGEDTSGPLSDALAEAMGESSATSISEGAAHGMIELGQMVGTKTWNCMFRNSRDSHMDADGQTVAVDELFVLAGGEGMYPGDPELPPEESINCGCWVTYSIDSPDEGVVEGEASADEEGGALADITPGDSGDGTADAGALSVGRVPQKRGVGLYAAGDVALLRDGTDSVTLVNSKSLADNSNGGRWAVREFGGPGSGPHKLTDAEKADRAERKAVIDEQKSLKGTTGKEGRPRDEAKIAEIRGTKGSDTQKDFKDANGKYTPERQALHAQIIASFLEGVPKADGTPSVTFLGGGPAAGKSTVETSGRSGMPSTANREAVLVNADEIKNMLPEMDKLVEVGDRGAAGFVHEESSDVSAMLLQAALDGGYHTVVDAVGDSSTEKMGAKIDAARASGAAVKGLYVTAPTDVAVARAEARGEKKGRFVGESIVRAGHASVSRIFPQIADKFDSVQLFDSGTGGEPKLLGEGTLGQPFTVHDDAGYGTFLAKGTA